MSLIRPVEMNMDISRAVLEGKWDNALIEVAQKVALYTILPFSMIVMFEAIVKNCIFINALNVGITLLNEGHSLYQEICTST